MTQSELFTEPAVLPLAEGACVLRGLALDDAPVLLKRLHQDLLPQAPWRHLTTPGGYRMSVAMTNCGGVGWVSDETGYRYDATDPTTGGPWPAMPAEFVRLAAHAAEAAGFPGFSPDACLVNLYVPGSRLSLHQDRDERDRSAPIVSVSLGLPATFLFGGLKRSERPQRVALRHGDVAVWGGPSRLAYHGVAPLASGRHELLGECRVNLTFRKVW